MRDGIVTAAAITPVWPDTEQSFALFVALQTQWRLGMGGATGLDYAAIPVVMELHDIPPPARRAVFDDIQIMEAEALRVMSEKRGRQ